MKLCERYFPHKSLPSRFVGPSFMIEFIADGYHNCVVKSEKEAS